MKKSSLAVFLGVLCLFVLGGCGSSDEPKPDPSAPAPAPPGSLKPPANLNQGGGKGLGGNAVKPN